MAEQVPNLLRNRNLQILKERNTEEMHARKGFNSAYQGGDEGKISKEAKERQRPIYQEY